MSGRGDLEKIPKSQTIRGPDLLKPLPPETKLFDNVSPTSSQSSELSCPFSDVVYSVEAESKKKAKDLYGKDLYTAFSFSPEFKEAMEQLKKQMLKENPNYLKDDSLVGENLEAVKVDSRAESAKQKPPEVGYKTVKFPGIDFEVESSEEEELEDKKKEKESEKDKKKKKIWFDEDDDMYDDMSGYWRMLSVFDEFKISPPWYDAYAEGKVHWMQTEPTPPEVLENSRRKCLDWLSNYVDKHPKLVILLPPGSSAVLFNWIHLHDATKGGDVYGPGTKYHTLRLFQFHFDADVTPKWNQMPYIIRRLIRR